MPSSVISLPVLAASTPGRSYWDTVWYQLRQDPMALFISFILLLIIFSAVFAPWVAPADRRSKHAAPPDVHRQHGPGLVPTSWAGTWFPALYRWAHLFAHGCNPGIGCILGRHAIGLFAGYVGGKVNMAIMRVLDVFYAFPSVLLAVAISGALGPGMSNSLIALSLIFIPQVVRVAESVTTQVRKLDYIEAARMSGAGAFSIIRVHVLSNVLGPVFVYTTGLLSVSMILASGLSFLGLGVKPPEPEWGLMLNTLRSAIYIDPWVAALPGALIFITSIAFNLLADSVRSAMDIRQ